MLNFFSAIHLEFSDAENGDAQQQQQQLVQQSQPDHPLAGDETPGTDPTEEHDVLPDTDVPAVRWKASRLFLSVEFYLVLGIEFCGVSIGMLFLQVLLASVHSSHGGEAGGQSTAVMVGSLANASGRFCLGLVSDKTLHKVKRTTWGVPMFWIMALGYLLVILVPQPEIVIAGAALIGFSYGGLAGGLIPTLVADIWGSKFFGINYGIVQAMNPLGFLVWGQVSLVFLLSSL